MSGNRDFPSVNKNKSSILRSYGVVAAGFLSLMVTALIMTSYGVFFKPVSTQFGWTHTETSGAFSIMMMVCGVLGVGAGRLGDKFNPRLVIIIGGILEGIAFILLSRMNSLWQLYLFYGIIAGTGMANIAPINSLVTRYYPRRRGAMMGIAMAGAGIGGTVIPPLVVYFISNFGWQMAYLITAGMILVLVLISGFFLYSSNQVAPLEDNNIRFLESARLRIPGISLRKAMGTLTFWIFSLVVFCSGFIQQVVSVHIVPGASDRGVTLSAAAGILSVINLACMSGSFSFGIILDRIGGFSSMLIALVSTAVGLILFLAVHQLWGFYLFAILFGIGWGVIAVARPIMVAELFGLLSHGEIIGAIIFLYTFGGTVGPIAAGYIYDVNQHYQIVFILIAGLGLINLALTLPLYYLSFRKRNVIPSSPPEP